VTKSREAHACQDHAHDGDRIVDRRDLFEERVEYRSVYDQSRYRTKTLRRICRVCVDRLQGGSKWEMDSLWP
jgi:hypothetical protein